MSTWQPFLTSFIGDCRPFYGYKLDIGSDDICIHISGLKPPFYDEVNMPYSFVEGLWRWDCGELWLCNPENGRYIEFNLAPDGCYWACVFALPRLRDGEVHAPKCIADTVFDENGWFANLTISLDEIERCIGIRSGFIGNVTLIEGGCPDVNPQLENLHSVCKLGAVDFHRPQDWIPIDEIANFTIPEDAEFDFGGDD